MLRQCLTAIRTLQCRLTGRPNRRRWTNPSSFPPDWDARAQRIAELIPTGSRVMEFGSGLCRLAKFLDHDCTYIPSDFISRGPGSVVLDLNQRPLPDVRGFKADIAVFAGVLEYLPDVPGIVQWLAPQIPVCVASYECSAPVSGALQRMRNVFSRAGCGWVNAYSKEELVQMFSGVGYRCDLITTWPDSGPGRIFVFRREDCASNR